MAQRLDDTSKQVQNANGKKNYVAQQATGAASASLQLNNVAYRGSNVLGAGTGRLLCLQGSADFRYNLSNGSGTATANDILVKAGAPGDFVYAEATDTFLNVIQDTAGGIVRVYCVE